MQYVFLSHDVDWRRQGPPIEHVIKRKERFDENAFKDVTKKNLYYNMPQYMDLEEKYGVRSTFFFRTVYDNGDYMDYEDDIIALIKGGWEVGLHLSHTSVDDFNKIKEEKDKLEKLTHTKITGNRVHYLGFNKQLPQKLSQLGFVYDSSITRSKYQIHKDDLGYHKYDKLIEFPVTIMDAYLFTYMKITEDQVIPTFRRTVNLETPTNQKFKIITIIWHDNVLNMIGGRMYEKILEYLTSQDDVRICRGIDLAKEITVG